MQVGIKELRDGLSRHLSEVREGRTITVTDHGRPIARIIPIDTPTTLDRLILEGRVRPARKAKSAAPVPVPARGTVSDLAEEQRR
ncbi:MULTISPECIES: type II toxin-antitoxin system Phd/YefM family antitoxin [unclassified Nocardiopsis]|uniref:type II toxin-antitoxin system Phd/YefM family antitoxin n=1 Tax=Nocardiopsis TaxID=2013 RepID=UPI00387AB00E